MHSLELVDGWIVNMNGDFSGDILIRNHDLKISVDIPFDVLKCVVTEYVRRNRISRLEQETDDETLGVSGKKS